jgi:hypothetical protein
VFLHELIKLSFTCFYELLELLMLFVKRKGCVSIFLPLLALKFSLVLFLFITKLADAAAG